MGKASKLLDDAFTGREYRDLSTVYGYVARIPEGAGLLELFAAHDGNIGYDDYHVLPAGAHAGHATHTTYTPGVGHKTHPAVLIDPRCEVPEQISGLLREGHLCWQNMVVAPAHEVPCTLDGRTGRLQALPTLALTRFMDGAAYAFSRKTDLKIQQEAHIDMPHTGGVAEKKWSELFHEYQRSNAASMKDLRILGQFEAATAGHTRGEVYDAFPFSSFDEEDGAGCLANIARQGMTLGSPLYVEPGATNDQLLGLTAAYLGRETIARARKLTPA